MSMNPARGARIEALKQAVERAGLPPLSRGQAVTQRLVTRWAREQTVEQGPRIEARSTGHERQPSAGRHLGEYAAREPRILAGRKYLLGIEDVQQMMRYARAVAGRQLGSSDVEIPVELHGIAIYHFARERRGHAHRQFALTRAGGAQNGDNLVLRHAVLGGMPL